jgi:hypothetical protein
MPARQPAGRRRYECRVKEARHAPGKACRGKVSGAASPHTKGETKNPTDLSMSLRREVEGRARSEGHVYGNAD